jgi:hypothetical protein
MIFWRNSDEHIFGFEKITGGSHSYTVVNISIVLLKRQLHWQDFQASGCSLKKGFSAIPAATGLQ